MKAVIHFMNHKEINSFESFTGLFPENNPFQVYSSETKRYKTEKSFMDDINDLQNAPGSTLSYHTNNRLFEHWIFVLE